MERGDERNDNSQMPQPLSAAESDEPIHSPQADWNRDQLEC